MVSLSDLQFLAETGRSPEFQCQANLNLYDSPALQALATQAVAGRHLRIMIHQPLVQIMAGESAIEVQLCEDDYQGWLSLEDIDLLEPAEDSYRASTLTAEEIQARIPQVIQYVQTAMAQPNHYLWGGTVGPNYDCSGLMQTAFAVAGIWLPRDSYQQEDFTQPIAPTDLQPGDLIFFGTPERTNHVGLYLGDNCYAHSSGRELGRNGIGIDRLSAAGDAVSQAYYQLFRRAGRVVANYQPAQEQK